MSTTNDIYEKEALFEKNYECPICGTEIKAKTVKTGKCKLVTTDEDLRPVYKDIDSLKYDIVFCNHCGYAILKKFFDEPLVPVQKKMVEEKFAVNFKAKMEEPEIYTYEDSIKRHKIALLCSLVKDVKISEQAYTALKIAWLYRGQREHLEGTEQNLEERKKELQALELEYISKAYYGFTKAYRTEEFPVCGMDEATFCYLLADLCFKTEHYDEAKQWIGMVISSREASPRVKEKARDLKDLIFKAAPSE